MVTLTRNKDALTISFREPEIHFATGRSFVKEEFKLILSNFFPRYLNVLKNYNQEIEEIRIEGHTSSSWENALNVDEAYLNNMSLSQDRSKQVLIYSLGLNLDENKNWAKNLIIATVYHLVNFYLEKIVILKMQLDHNELSLALKQTALLC